MTPPPCSDDGISGEQRLYDRQRAELVSEIESEFRATADYTGRDAMSPPVREAMMRVPRHRFVPEAERRFSYINHALPIGWEQTISQPYIVALMTDALDPEPGDVVLEIGTGSGYQAAVLSRLVDRVYTVEVVPELAERAADVLARDGYDNVSVRCGDGAHGWPEHAPYDKIIVTAEDEDIPEHLIAQLKTGGKLIMPLGDSRGQQLTLAEKQEDGTLKRRILLPVSFVPLRSPR